MRQSAAEDVQGRKVETSGDLFGQHEGSVAIRAMRTVVPSGADEHLVFTIQTSGLGRDYVCHRRARTPDWQTPDSSAQLCYSYV